MEPEDETVLVEQIRSMSNEFNFAARCMLSGINGESEVPIWNTYFNIPEPEDPYFTDSTHRTILRLIDVEMSVPAHVVFQSWFVGNRITRPLAKALMDVSTAYFLKGIFQADGFLKHCAKMAELAALIYMAGIVEIPEYAIGCLLYVIKICDDRNLIDWGCIRAVDEHYCSVDVDEPDVHFSKIMGVRESILEGFSLE